MKYLNDQYRVNMKDFHVRFRKKFKVKNFLIYLIERLATQLMLSLLLDCHELPERIRKGHDTPFPVRRVEIPKPDGEMRKLGINLTM